MCRHFGNVPKCRDLGTFLGCCLFMSVPNDWSFKNVPNDYPMSRPLACDF